MSKATKRKHVAREVLEDYVEPEGDQEIVKVLGGQGNNLHKVVTVGGDTFLASMPTKFRRNVWIKRGDFVIVEPIAEGDRVRAEIIHILYPRQIKHLCQEKLWPEAFQVPYLKTNPVSTKAEAENTKPACAVYEEEEESSDDDSDLFVNTNRPPAYEEDDGDEEDDEEDEEEEEGSEEEQEENGAQKEQCD